MDLEVQSDKALAYVTFRLSLGIGELMHGLVRLPIMATFAADMAKGFEGTILPGWFVYAFGLVLPSLEGADRNFAYCRAAHKMGTFCRIASHVDSDLWNLPALGLGNGRRTNDLRHGLLPGLSIS